MPSVAVAVDNSSSVTNSGDIDVSGGTVINIYSSYADGGNASMEVEVSYGGDGDEIHVLETGSLKNTGHGGQMQARGVSRTRKPCPLGLSR
ncbi:MAG: homogentisate 1,2-dioxygenase [Gammaproteobacteria bacterium]|nr:homogentisate 1,2-dioxygenase [Gammaproteobacteria bacterium]MCW8840613.1 homogentisate 1,2-dioxygenase [Gammaproteobacteria bacterium]MCW8973618.1 homogentisate 1,2-dioxygenase [Gammaproteobacteria bacterium]MCW8993750.1 homogentisate 1,2-dioxygenase [Gammaproteobacteria bacterium]